MRRRNLYPVPFQRPPAFEVVPQPYFAPPQRATILSASYSKATRLADQPLKYLSQQVNYSPQALLQRITNLTMSSPSAQEEEPKKHLEQITFRFCSEW